jgi:thiamine-monophosphate kinase
MRSEFEFIHNIKKKYGLVHVGDDCAVLPKDAETDLLVTADMLVEDVDFRLEWTSPELLGAKALAVSLSDIAAMGGTPRWAMLSIGIPHAVWGSPFVDKLYEGWHTLAEHHKVEMIGGDVSRTPEKVVIDSVVLGEVGKGRAILRSGARAGDSIFVTGSLGGAAGGLLLLESGTVYAGAAKWQQNLISRQIRPTARVDTGLAICGWEAATAMIDLSDGLSSDLAHICESSGVGARLDASEIPVDPDLDGLAMSRDQRLGLALNGGEDFELLFTVPGNAALPDDIPALKIGVITDDAGVLELLADGSITHLAPRGFKHF